MASNPYVNKVVYGNTTIIDLSVDTVNSSDDIASGKIAHLSTGEQVVGTGGTTPKGTIITTAPSGSVVTLTKESTVYTPSEVRRVNPKWRNLPSGYTQVEYIESTSEQTYINMAINPQTPISTIETRAVFSVSQNPASRQFAFAYGSGDCAHYVEIDATGKWSLGNGQAGTQVECVVGQEYSIKHIINGRQSSNLYVDDTLSLTNTLFQSDTDVNPQRIFNIAGVAYGVYIRCSSFMSVVDDVLVRDYVPCLNTSTNKYGLYDMVSQTFFGNAGSGDFTGGSAVSQYLDTSLYTQLVDYGTWTVQGTLSGKSASATVVVDATQEYEVELAYELYLYNAGDECTSITGGWDVSNSVVYQSWSSFARGSATKEAESINASLASNRYTSYGTNNQIDLSGYTKLKIEINISAYSATTHIVKLSVAPAKSFSAQDEYAGIEFSGMATGSYVYELDISDVANAGYVCISEFSMTTQLSAVWLE